MSGSYMFSFSAKEQDARIIQDYLDRSRKKGMIKSQLIVGAIKKQIAEEEQEQQQQSPSSQP